ncbi:Hydrogen peroxide stress regulator 1 [Porphyridium purpureum]|uniref:Hydrogen peroxide stress regulator 1 n=1 Tax=Porphyridium purpureum TaxID=35688 RepID=A0A5J4YTG1_PORPP|nr:Hydrogen peroxide stress regulator 1 [Porphyridium purpureum]|eukprot:POR0819..scf227_4
MGADRVYKHDGLGPGLNTRYMSSSGGSSGSSGDGGGEHNAMSWLAGDSEAEPHLLQTSAAPLETFGSLDLTTIFADIDQITHIDDTSRPNEAAAPEHADAGPSKPHSILKREARQLPPMIPVAPGPKFGFSRESTQPSMDLEHSDDEFSVDYLLDRIQDVIADEQVFEWLMASEPTVPVGVLLDDLNGLDYICSETWSSVDTASDVSARTAKHQTQDRVCIVPFASVENHVLVSVLQTAEPTFSRTPEKDALVRNKRRSESCDVSSGSDSESVLKRSRSGGLPASPPTIQRSASTSPQAPIHAVSHAVVRRSESEEIQFIQFLWSAARDRLTIRFESCAQAQGVRSAVAHLQRQPGDGEATIPSRLATVRAYAAKQLHTHCRTVADLEHATSAEHTWSEFQRMQGHVNDATGFVLEYTPARITRRKVQVERWSQVRSLRPRVAASNAQPSIWRMHSSPDPDSSARHGWLPDVLALKPEPSQTQGHMKSEAGIRTHSAEDWVRKTRPGSSVGAHKMSLGSTLNLQRARNSLVGNVVLVTSEGTGRVAAGTLATDDTIWLPARRAPPLSSGSTHTNSSTEENADASIGPGTPPAFPCHHCGKRFKRVHDRRRHELEIHSSDTVVECDICGVRMARKSNLMRHRQNVHGKK